MTIHRKLLFTVSNSYTITVIEVYIMYYIYYLIEDCHGQENPKLSSCLITSYINAVSITVSM